MTANYVLLATQTVGATGAASVTFSNIPQTGYTDLKVVVSARKDTTGVDVMSLAINGGSTSISSNKYLDSNATGTPRSGSVNGYQALMQPSDYTSNTFGNAEFYIPNYNSTTTYKSISVDSVLENNASASYSGFSISVWPSNSAITSLAFTTPSANFVSGSTFSLYGLAAVGTTPALAPFASGGDVIANDGTYWYHAFKTTGAFVPAKALSADVLVVAGGASAGSNQRGGGGGAGGLLSFTSQALTATSYTCTVGAGGASTASTGIKGNNGNNSQFGALTAAIGGGAGSSGGGSDANTGGSGGGVSYYNNTGAAGTSGQGYKGGNTTNSWPVSSGGGGAGGAGGDARSSTLGGVGGVGATSSLITAMGTATATGENVSGSYYFAGGGGGGSDGNYTSAGGYGGGGDGKAPPGEDGTANTGGGGGGGSYYSPSFAAGGAGGSGIIIIRYAMV